MWAPSCERSASGLSVSFAVTLPLVLVTESRFILGAWPSLMSGLALASDRFGTSKLFGYPFGALTILNSQLWLRFNIGPWEGNDYANLTEFPKQIFFFITDLGWAGRLTLCSFRWFSVPRTY